MPTKTTLAALLLWLAPTCALAGVEIATTPGGTYYAHVRTGATTFIHCQLLDADGDGAYIAADAALVSAGLTGFSAADGFPNGYPVTVNSHATNVYPALWTVELAWNSNSELPAPSNLMGIAGVTGRFDEFVDFLEAGYDEDDHWAFVAPVEVAADGIDQTSIAANTGLRRLAYGTATAGSASTITLQAGGSSGSNDFYTGETITLVSGTGVGQSRTVTGYNGGTFVATVTPTWVTQPTSGTDYTINRARGSVGLIADGAVTAAVVATGAVDADAVADDSIDAGAVAASTIGASEVAADAIGASEVATDALGAAEIAADAIGASEVAADAVGASEIAADAIATSELAATAATEVSDAVGASTLGTRIGNIYTAVELDGSVYRFTENALEEIDVSGVEAIAQDAADLAEDAKDAAEDALAAAEAAQTAAEAAQTATEAVPTAAQLWAYGTRTITGTGADAITAASLAPDAIGASELAADAIGASELAAGAIGAAEVATDAIDADAVADGAVDAGAIATDAITAAEVAADAIGASEFAADAEVSTTVGASTLGTNVAHLATAIELDGSVYRFTENALEEIDVSGVVVPVIEGQPRINAKPDPGFTLKVSRRADGTYKCTSPIRLTAGAVNGIIVAIDMSPLFGTKNVANVAGDQAEVSGGSVTVVDNDSYTGPHDYYAYVGLAGTATSAERREVTIPVSIVDGPTIPVVFDVWVF